mmetsp:Transcript_80513/g.209660  ORF Transcript_80513/g.209660 Transcript_80513/m.209660 type:complete len:417 (+) Transcript_80513:86-1336(+)
MPGDPAQVPGHGHSLEEGEVGTREHSLGPVQRLNLVGPSFHPHVKVGQEPVALLVQAHDDLHVALKLLGVGLVVGLVLQQRLLGSRLGGLLGGQRLGVCLPLVRGIRHEMLVVALGILLAGLHLGHLLGEVLDEQVDHGDDAAALLGLGRILLLGLPLHLHEGGAHACACNATRGRSGRSITTQIDDDAVRRCELHLRCRLIPCRIVEFHQPVLCNVEQLLSSSVGRQVLLVVRILLLPQLRGLDDLMVQVLDARSQRLDVDEQSLHHFLALRDGRGDLGLRTLQVLLQVIGGVELLRAVGLLAVVVRLLLLEQGHHLVEHANDLVKVDLLSSHRQRDEIEAEVVPLAALQSPTGLVQHVLARVLHLDETRSRNGLLEQVQGIIIIEDLDGVGEGDELVSPRLHNLVPLPAPGAAI